jgi:hypothetical protein
LADRTELLLSSLVDAQQRRKFGLTPWTSGCSPSSTPTWPGSSPPQADRGPRRIVLIPAKDHPNVTSRTSPPSDILGPGQLYWSAAITDSFDPLDSDIVMPGAAMTVTRRGEALVVQVAPSGAELDFFEVIADIMVEVVVEAFQPAAPAAHRPRITIDRFVLSREQWRFQVADSAWAFAKDEQERFYLARRWRQEHNLPERVFYRVPVELKPTAADFRSIVLVNLFAKHIRQTQAAGHTQYAVTKMLPDLDQLWLTDRQGRRYSSELRIIAYDSMTEDHPPRRSACVLLGWSGLAGCGLDVPAGDAHPPVPPLLRRAGQAAGVDQGIAA